MGNISFFLTLYLCNILDFLTSEVDSLHIHNLTLCLPTLYTNLYIRQAKQAHTEGYTQYLFAPPP